jgi:hypothetical protein
MRYKDIISTFLDEEAYSFDVVIVHGELFPEQKFHNIQTFCMQEDLSTVDAATGKTICFVPRIIFSSAGVAGAGLDNSDVPGVHRYGYPPTLLDYIQEGGRMAWYPTAVPTENRYLVNISWQSFCSLLFRIYVVPLIEQEQKEGEHRANEATQLDGQQPSTTTPESLCSQRSNMAPSLPPVAPTTVSTLLGFDDLAMRQYDNLLRVLKVIHLYLGCLHVKLEQASANPFVATCHRPPSPCVNACFFCVQAPASRALYSSVNRSGLSELLVAHQRFHQESRRSY